MKFTTKSGLVLEYDGYKHDPPLCTEVTILGEARGNLLKIRDSEGTKAVISKEILAANGISFAGATMTLGYDLYVQHFGNSTPRRHELAAATLKRHFALLVEHRELILSRPEFFLIRLMQSGGWPGINASPCLGGLLETFGEPGPLRLETFPEHGPLQLVCVNGSMGSGACYATCWSEKKRRLVHIQPGLSGYYPRKRRWGGDPVSFIETRPGGFSYHFNLMKAIADRYPHPLPNAFLRMEALVREVIDPVHATAGGPWRAALKRTIKAGLKAFARPPAS